MFHFKINDNNCILNISDNYIQFGNKKKLLNTTTHINKNRVYMKFNSNCNIKCIYCFQAKDNKINNIKLDSYNSLIEKININDELIIFGGEPFLLKNSDNLNYIFNIINRKVKMFTNACYKKYYNDFILSNRDKIQELIITIDGPENIHNSRRIMPNDNAYQIIMSNLNFYIQNSIPFRIQVNLDNDNIGFLKKLLTDLNNKFNDSILYIALNKVLHTKNTVSEIDFLETYLLYKDMFPNLKLSVNSIVLRKLGNYLTGKGLDISRCTAGESLVFDFTTNNIYPCPQSIEMNIGTFTSTDYSITHEKQQSIIGIRNKNKSLCSDCEYIHFCKYGCILDTSPYNCKAETEIEIQYILNNFDRFFKIK